MTKNIVQISPFAFDHPGGVEQYARTLQELFPDEMTTLAGGADFPIIELVKHFPFPAFWKRGFWNVFTNIDKENTKCIISHIRFAPTAWIAFSIAKRRKIPYIHIEHGTGFLVHNNPFIAWIAKMVDLTIGKYIIRHAERVITVSQAGRQWVSATFGRSDVEVIYRGFEFPKVERVKNEVPKIGFVGRLTGLKNVAGLLEALSELKDEKWTLEIVGDGEERTNLEKLVSKLGITERVSLLGAKPHDWIMTEFYPSVDIFVNPSLQEGLPTTVIEALGMGCQVIATDVGGTREIEGIKLVTIGDIKELREAIIKELGNKGNEVMEEGLFSLEIMKDNYNSFFQSFSTSKYYFLINSLEGGGAERVVTTFAKELAKEYHVTIITLKKEIFFDLPENVRHIALSSVKQNIFLIFLVPYFVWKLRKLFKTENFISGVSFLEIANFVHILAKRDAIISFRTSIGLFRGITGAVYKMFMRFLYPQAKTIIVGSYENRAKISRYLSVPEQKVVVIPNPIDIDNIQKLSKEGIDTEISERMIGKRVYITTGRLIESKHHDKILKSLAKIENKDFLYLIIGDGPERGHLSLLTHELDIAENVAFLGAQKNVFPYLAKANIFLYASDIEGFPNVLIEAIAMGLPIITTDFETGAREVISGNAELIGKNIDYPYFGPNGVLLNQLHFGEQLQQILTGGNVISQKQVSLSSYDVRNISLSIFSLINHEN